MGNNSSVPTDMKPILTNDQLYESYSDTDTNKITILSSSPDGQWIATTCYGSKTIQIWDANTLVQKNDLKVTFNLDASSKSYELAGLLSPFFLLTQPSDYFIGNFVNIVWSPNSNLIASHDNNNIIIWDISGNLIRIISNQNRDGLKMSFVPKWNLGHTQTLNSIQWAPNSSNIMSSSLDSIRLWDMNTGLQIYILKYQSVGARGFGHPSPNNLYLANNVSGTNSNNDFIISNVDFTNLLAVKSIIQIPSNESDGIGSDIPIIDIESIFNLKYSNSMIGYFDKIIWSPNSLFILTYTNNGTPSLRIFDLTKHKFILELKFSVRIVSCVWNHHSTCIIICFTNKIKFYNIRDRVSIENPISIKHIVVSRNKVIYCTDHQIKMFPGTPDFFNRKPEP